MVPATRSMFMPADRACATAAWDASGQARKVTGSRGVQQAPRQKIDTPLTFNEKFPLAVSSVIVRNPTRPIAMTVSSRTPAMRILKEAEYSEGSPWVWGHHKSTLPSCSCPAKKIVPTLPERRCTSTRPQRSSCSVTASIVWPPRGSHAKRHLTVPVVSSTLTSTQRSLM